MGCNPYGVLTTLGVCAGDITDTGHLSPWGQCVWREQSRSPSEPPSGSRPAAGRGAGRPGAVITTGRSWLDRQGQLRPEGGGRYVSKPAAWEAGSPDKCGRPHGPSRARPQWAPWADPPPRPGRQEPGNSLYPATCPLPPSLFLFQNANLAPCGADLDASWGTRGTGSGDPVGLWLGQGSLTGFHEFRSETTPDQGRWQKALSIVESGSLGQSCPCLFRSRIGLPPF